MTDTENTSIQKRIKLLLISFVVFVFGLGLFYILTIDKPLDEEYKPVYEYGGDFTLRNHMGDIALHDFKGKVVVVYFGFLNCTEACPESMGTMVRAMRKLTPEQKANLQVLFVSVDPERDDIESLQAFTAYYQKMFKDEVNPNMIMAITGTTEEIDKVSKLYGVYFDLVDLEGSGLGYTVDHSSRFYMVDGNGNLQTTMNHSTTPIELAARIEQMQQALSLPESNNDSGITETQINNPDHTQTQ